MENTNEQSVNDQTEFELTNVIGTLSEIHPKLKNDFEIVKSLDITVELIDPDMAEKLLQNHNSHNRCINKTALRKYVQDVKEGRWEFTHQAIAFDINGTLLDGQHRLQTVVSSKTPMFFLIVRNLPKKVGLVTDIHSKRRIGDAVALSRTEENQHWTKNMFDLAAAITKKIFEFESGNFGRASADQSTNNSLKYSRNDIVEFIINNVDRLEEAMGVANTCFETQKEVDRSIIGALYDIFSRKVSKIAAVEFFKSYATGANLQFGHPVLILRELFLKHRVKPSGVFKYHRTRIYSLIRAWNCYVQNELNVNEKAIKFVEDRDIDPSIKTFDGSDIIINKAAVSKLKQLKKQETVLV